MLDLMNPRLIDGVSFERSDDHSRLRLVATRDLIGIRGPKFAEPVVGVEFVTPAVPSDVEYLGYAFTQFALPVIARGDLGFDFHPAPNLHAPSAMLPLLARSSEGCTLLAPISNPHEQIIAVVDGMLVWGWHGDLDEIPAGFATELGVYHGDCPTEVFDRWGADVRSIAGVVRPRRSDNPVTSHLSYWTDNGAAYWYRTEPGRTIAESVADAVEQLRADGVPVVGVELDSWFYPHETNRPIADIGYPADVPPTGAWRWEPRTDAFASTTEDLDDIDDQRDAIERFADRLGRPPLVLHARHIDPASPYVEPSTWWVDDLAAQPTDPAFFRRWFDDAARWGATCIEQDWMLMYWFGVRALRASPGRAMAWQQTLNDHARATGIDLMWCMATPADMIAAASLDRVIAIRTSDDYRFSDDPALLWTWFLTVNRLVAPLGLVPFKDCFFSNADPGSGGDAIDGDPHAQLEALLSAMSSGPVGIGDRRGHTDRNIVMRTCDDDGMLLQPDHPIGMIDACLFGAPARGERLAWATTSSSIDGQTWTYVVAINTSTERVSVTDCLDVTEEFGFADDHVLYDWRQATWTIGRRIEITLAPRDWALVVACPIVDGRAVLGDPAKYVTMAGHPQHRRSVQIPH
jgi:hypothetical protein